MWNYKATATRVVDGDTIDLDVDMGFCVHVNVRCRLYGIDTPETHGVQKNSDEHKAGMKATEFVNDWLAQQNGHEVVIRSYDSGPPRAGKYGRWLVEVFSHDDKDVSLNEILIREGLAKNYDGGSR